MSRVRGVGSRLPSVATAGADRRSHRRGIALGVAQVNVQVSGTVESIEGPTMILRTNPPPPRPASGCSCGPASALPSSKSPRPTAPASPRSASSAAPVPPRHPEAP